MSVSVFLPYLPDIRRIRLFVACLAVPYFSILDLIKGKILGKEFIEHKMCLIFGATFV